MGYQDNSFSLVSMTNKDVYYVTEDTAKELMALVKSSKRPEFYEVTDVKNKTLVTIAIGNISSIVVKEAGRG